VRSCGHWEERGGVVRVQSSGHPPGGGGEISPDEKNKTTKEGGNYIALKERFLRGFEIRKKEGGHPRKGERPVLFRENRLGSKGGKNLGTKQNLTPHLPSRKDLLMQGSKARKSQFSDLRYN